MKTQLSIYICLHGATVVGAGKTLPKLVNNTALLAAKSYHFYYRMMRGKQEITVFVNNETFKIIKINYAK